MTTANKIRIILISFLGILNFTHTSYSQTIAGKDWIKVSEAASFSPRSEHQIVLFRNKLWLIGGTDSSNKAAKDTWYSDDGIHWKQASKDNGFSGGQAVVFNGKLWIINADGKGVWNSSDGIEWQKTAALDSAAEYGTSVTVFKNKIWLTGGAEVINAYLPDGKLNPGRKIIWKNDVWSSSDGIKWVKLKTNSCFPERSDHSFLVFKNKLWIIAGQSGPNKNDVWCSDDGINWELVADAPFRARHVSQVVEYQNRLWIIGGFGSDDKGYPILLSDVWNSSDGKTWNEVNSSSPFGMRMEHKAIVFKDKLWIYGGQTGTFQNRSRMNDIWCTEFNQQDQK